MSAIASTVGSGQPNHEENVAVVERLLAAFTRRWPTGSELDELLGQEVQFVERPNLVNPVGGKRDAASMRAGIDRARDLLAWQEYVVLGHLTCGDVVVTRMRWSAETAVDAGPWRAGTRLRAWCVAHYRLDAGRIVDIEQHDCYETPAVPQDSPPL